MSKLGIDADVTKYNIKQYFGRYEDSQTLMASF